LYKFETIFALHMCWVIFQPCELFAKLLQAVNMTATEVSRKATLLIQGLKAKRSLDSFNKLYEEVSAFTRTLTSEIKPLKSPRPIRPPKRFEYSENSQAYLQLPAGDRLRLRYFNCLMSFSEW
jgi:hypothetical protein